MKIAFPTIIAASALAVGAFGLTAAHAQSVTQPSVHQISSKKTTIAFLLPENSSPRYEQVDRPWFIKMAHAADPNAKLIVSNANSSPDTQLNQAESAISNGADVLVVDPVDGKAGAAIVNYAARNHVKVISYDRLIQDSKPDYYVSFDNTKVGELQGEYIAKHTKPGGSVMMINGAPTDPNAFDFRKGAMNVLGPLFKSGKLHLAYSVMTPDWSPQNAFEESQQALTRLHNKVNAVLAANDGTASGVIRALQAVGLAGKVPVTGQDATNGGLTFILEGLQSMTVFKYVPEEAAAAAELAVAVATDTKPPAGLLNGKTNNKMIDVPSVLLKPLVVTKANIAGSVIKSGYTTWKAICVGPAAQGKICKAHGA
ncbi:MULTISPECIES: sugar ABC transporter substrate-binding protein [Acidiphilium]|jgi:D-xylose transport system substrate-binding protein|uniref:Monosaccharide ABC transporter substrate-binding protein, CUT2 family n=2 Tax=Acidiphilium TaxID=522 RepID=A5FZZ2_ACICJ|nr:MULTISPECIES: sugar ABC transporter substrate-binding protein [Acidiphilium]MBU6355946.1 sugar ABC transporter substrate-binding protein [Rhodospirillales bacterium]ABQ31174.1 monosaccharide ABC transporter substrate-binding protein, CUT2 family [Acidiphilium cryptum JF-5]EGO96333.1 Monosaccharide-transporting ATPase [Acidiphilium sp. PM]MBS3023104.1 sugar ABC transporter substrate-binding protein [Acidiphilium multivorum]MDE2327981.1 sugar ABC transporter substrate-binding protein [Rhodosp